MITVIAIGDRINKEVECKECGSVLGYTLLDIKEKIEIGHNRNKTITKYVNCPECKSDVFLSGVLTKDY